MFFSTAFLEAHGACTFMIHAEVHRELAACSTVNPLGRLGARIANAPTISLTVSRADITAPYPSPLLAALCQNGVGFCHTSISAPTYPDACTHRILRHFLLTALKSSTGQRHDDRRRTMIGQTVPHATWAASRCGMNEALTNWRSA